MLSNLKYHLFTFTLIQQHVFTYNLILQNLLFIFFFFTEDIFIMRRKTIIIINHWKKFEHYDSFKMLTKLFEYLRLDKKSSKNLILCSFKHYPGKRSAITGYIVLFLRISLCVSLSPLLISVISASISSWSPDLTFM